MIITRKRRQDRRNDCQSTAVSRRGGIMVVAMICLVLTSLILGSLLKAASVHRRQMQNDHLRMQAEWLAEAGLERAADRLTANTNYTGETWQISKADLGGDSAGSVQIAVEPVAGAADQRAVSVTAVFPTETTRCAKRSKKMTVRVPANP